MVVGISTVMDSVWIISHRYFNSSYCRNCSTREINMLQSNFQTLLKGYKPGTPQRCGVMTLIPILTDKPYQEVGAVGEISLYKDPEYQRMEFKNDSNKISIIPHGFMFLTAEHAQDRVVNSAHLAKAGAITSVDVDCLQPSQGGHLQPGLKEWRLLPSALKLAAWSHAGDNQYDSLWNDMRSYLSNAGVSGGELIMFYKHFQKDLDEFVAQFEPVTNQVGAIILFGNEVAGIEIVPNYEIWKEMWKPLVRDSYGADAIVLVKKGYSQANRPLINVDQIHTFEDLEGAVADIMENNVAFARSVMGSVLNEVVMAEQKEMLDDLTLYDFTSSNYKGQAVMHGPEHFIYVTAVPASSKEVTQPRREFSATWNDQNPYSGNDFSI